MRKFDNIFIVNPSKKKDSFIINIFKMNIVVFIERGKLFYMEFVKKHPTKKEECIDLFHTFLDNIEAGSDLESELELFMENCNQLLEEKSDDE